MTMFRLEAPDGKTYRVEAPDAASAAQALEEMMGQGGAPPVAGGSSPAAAATPGAAAGTPDRGSIVDPLAQGLLLGLPDEIVGAMGGAADWMGLGPEGSKGTFSGGYDRMTGQMRGDLEAYRERNPIASAAAEIGGAVATLPIAGAANIVRAPAAISRAAPAAARAVNNLGRGAAVTANSAITGAGYGGLYGAATAEGGPAERAQGALQGGAFGGAIGVAAPIVAPAGKWIAQQTIGRPIKAVANALAPRYMAERQVVNAIKKDAATGGKTVNQTVSDMEAMQRSGIPVTALDIGESTRGLGRAASDISPQGRSILSQSVDQRFETQADRVIDTITKHAPGVNTPGTRGVLERAAERTNRANYGRAYTDGAQGIWTPSLEGLTVSPDIQSAIKDATRIGANAAATRGQRPPVNPFKQNPDGTLNPIPSVRPTLEFWDHVKRSIDGQIGIQQRAGNKEYASQLIQLKNQLVANLDQAVPSYKAARAGAFGFFGAENALDAGAAFVRRTGDNEGARAAIAKMTPAERSLFGEGFATKLIEDIRNIPGNFTVINKVFQSPAAKERLEIALGPQAVDAMEVTMRLEAILAKGRDVVKGGSHTAEYLAAQVAIGGGAGYAFSGGDPWTAVISGILSGVVGGGARGMRNYASEQTSRRIAEMLASNDPKVVREAIRRISGNPQMMQSLRTGHAWITRALTPLAQDTAPAAVLGDAGAGSEPAQANQ